MAGDKDEAATLAAVGTWGMQLHTFRLPDLSPAADEALGSDAIPRSVLLAVFDGAPFLLCALGDGQLYNFHINADTGRPPFLRTTPSSLTTAAIVECVATSTLSAIASGMTWLHMHVVPCIGSTFCP